MKYLRNLASTILKKSILKRRLFFLIFDIILISLSMYISFWLRLDGTIQEPYKTNLIYFILMGLIIKLIFMAIFNLYDISWRYVGLDVIIKVFKALSLSSLALGVTFYMLRTIPPFVSSQLPRSVLLLDYIFSLVFICSLRISKRVLLEGFKSALNVKKGVIRVLVVGAGSAGEQLIREMFRNNKSEYVPIGLIDDDSAKQGIKLHGIKILGTRDRIPEIVKNHKVDEILIAIPSASSTEIKKIVQIIEEIGMIDNIKILPGVSELISGQVSLADIQKIKLDDLLGRNPVKIEFKILQEFFPGKNVFITGAGGSIGSELVRSTLKFNPKTIILFDIDETELFYLLHKLKDSSTEIIPIIGNIQDKEKIRYVFEHYKPHIVFHAAAYKHVPILEYYPEEAIKTNIAGTKNIAELAIEYDLEKFVFISTDKAINPTSIMGATKRISEILLKIYNQKNITKFISVRFGNVLGSRGSVITLFQKQIENGGPITITHPEMKRYFMSTSEAALLVLESAVIGHGGEIFLLEMGEQVKIVDLAKKMIQLSNYNGDIPIIFTQIRPGEKLSEDIFAKQENIKNTGYKKILKVTDRKTKDSEFLMNEISLLIELSRHNNNRKKIIESLKKIDPSYTPLSKKSSKIAW